MKRKMITGIVLSTVLATGLFAFGQHQNMQGQNSMMGANQNQMMNSNYMNKNMQKHMKSNGKMHRMGKSHKRAGIMKFVRQLNLDEKQRISIRKIMQDNRKNMTKGTSAFTSTSFDKSKYIKIQKNKKENMLKKRADTIEKVYNVLNKKQKVQLKVLMDLKAEHMNKFSY